jgi:hypothetical protein
MSRLKASRQATERGEIVDRSCARMTIPTRVPDVLNGVCLARDANEAYEAVLKTRTLLILKFWVLPTKELLGVSSVDGNDQIRKYVV